MITWVIGRGGLLGSALARGLERPDACAFEIRDRFPWSDPERLIACIADEAARFAHVVAAAATHARWEIYWAAGVGTLSSKVEDLAAERRALESLCAALAASSLAFARGVLVLSSSAGAIYAGSSEPVIDERSADSPTTPYAQGKLDQESVARAFATSTGCALSIGRLSTLYGVGQATAKQQGLLTHISRCIVRNEPVRIFVPLDTIRDYLAADDAAAMMIEGARALAPGAIVMKIVASEVPTTISEIVSVFKRIARRPPRIITSGAPLSLVYKRRIQFRSVVAPFSARRSRTLLIGVGEVLAAERRRYAVGSASN